jgi:hypothetical protein
MQIPQLSDQQFAVLLIGITIWTIPWKVAALWRAAKNSQKGWFIALLLINTVGLLEILYLFVFSKKRNINN